MTGYNKWKEERKTLDVNDIEMNALDGMAEIITEIIKERKRKAWSQQEIANACKLRRSMIKTIEDYSKRPQFKYIMKMLQALDLRLEVKKNSGIVDIETSNEDGIYTYPAIVHKEAGNYVLNFVDFAEGYTFASNLENLHKNAQEVLHLTIYGRIKDRLQIPSPTLKKNVKIKKDADVFEYKIKLFCE